MSDKFHEQSVKILDACGDWLKKNAEDIADVLNEGCIDWDIRFSCSCQGDFSVNMAPIPEINISINKYPDRETIHHILSED